MQNIGTILKIIIGKVYYWFWHDVCKRPEPFTYSMRRNLNTKGNSAWWIAGASAGMGIFTWLLLHLGGFA
nr:hypothetical protein DMOBY_05790 [Dehalococcoides mccartyi]